MEEIDWYFIAVSVILTALVVFGNVYMMAYYAHSQDTKFASNVLMRFIVVSASESNQEIGVCFHFELSTHLADLARPSLRRRRLFEPTTYLADLASYLGQLSLGSVSHFDSLL